MFCNIGYISLIKENAAKGGNNISLSHDFDCRSCNLDGWVGISNNIFVFVGETSFAVISSLTITSYHSFSTICMVLYFISVRNLIERVVLCCSLFFENIIVLWHKLCFPDRRKWYKGQCYSPFHHSQYAAHWLNLSLTKQQITNPHFVLLFVFIYIFLNSLPLMGTNNLNKFNNTHMLSISLSPYYD